MEGTKSAPFFRKRGAECQCDRILLANVHASIPSHVRENTRSLSFRRSFDMPIPFDVFGLVIAFDTAEPPYVWCALLRVCSALRKRVLSHPLASTVSGRAALLRAISAGRRVPQACRLQFKYLPLEEQREGVHMSLQMGSLHGLAGTSLRYADPSWLLSWLSRQQPGELGQNDTGMVSQVVAMHTTVAQRKRTPWRRQILMAYCYAVRRGFHKFIIEELWPHVHPSDQRAFSLFSDDEDGTIDHMRLTSCTARMMLFAASVLNDVSMLRQLQHTNALRRVLKRRFHRQLRCAIAMTRSHEALRALWSVGADLPSIVFNYDWMCAHDVEESLTRGRWCTSGEYVPRHYIITAYQAAMRNPDLDVLRIVATRLPPFPLERFETDWNRVLHLTARRLGSVSLM